MSVNLLGVLHNRAIIRRPHKTAGNRREVVRAPRLRIVFAPAVLRSACFTIRNIQQLPPTCLLIAADLPTPEVWTVLVDRALLENRTRARLIRGARNQTACGLVHSTSQADSSMSCGNGSMTLFFLLI